MSTDQINANLPKINIINSGENGGGGVLDARCTASEDDCEQIKLKRNAGRIDQEHLDNDILRQPSKRLRTGTGNDHQNHHHNHYHHRPDEETNNNQLNENEAVSFRINPESSPRMVQLTTNPEEMASAQCPQIGKPAPQFKNMAVVNGQFKEISLSDYKGKYVVLFFYPMDFTFVCPTEIIAFSDRADEFRKVNCEVIAASTDSHYTHLAWVNTPRKEGGLGQMNIPLLADKTGQVSRDYGVYIESQGIPLRGLFIIDDKQNLRQITINDLPVGRNVDETIRLVQAFQYTDVHGEVCPANWKPGSATIKPSVESSKEYFSKNN